MGNRNSHGEVVNYRTWLKKVIGLWHFLHFLPKGWQRQNGTAFQFWEERHVERRLSQSIGERCLPKRVISPSHLSEPSLKYRSWYSPQHAHVDQHNDAMMTTMMRAFNRCSFETLWSKRSHRAISPHPPFEATRKKRSNNESIQTKRKQNKKNTTYLPKLAVGWKVTMVWGF